MTTITEIQEVVNQWLNDNQSLIIDEITTNEDLSSYDNHTTTILMTVAELICDENGYSIE